MKTKWKRILAWAAIVLLIGMYVAAFAASFMKGEHAQVLFRAALGCTIILPVLIYLILMVARAIGTQTPRMADCVIFDMGKVLLDCPWEETLSRIDVSPEAAALIREHVMYSSLWFKFDTDTQPREEIVSELAALAPGHEEEAKEYIRHIDDVVKPFPYTEGLLEKLRARGLKLYYLSNWSKESVEQFKKDGRLDFLQKMDGGIWSYEVHLAKPDPAIFRALIERFRLTPSRCLFVDDRSENIEAAKKLGFAGLLFTDYPSLTRQLEKTGLL